MCGGHIRGFAHIAGSSKLTFCAWQWQPTWQDRQPSCCSSWPQMAIKSSACHIPISNIPRCWCCIVTKRY